MLTILLTAAPGAGFGYESAGGYLPKHGKTRVLFATGHSESAAQIALDMHPVAAWLERERERLVAAKKLPEAELSIVLTDGATEARGLRNKVALTLNAKGPDKIRGLRLEFHDLPKPNLAAKGLLRAAAMVEEGAEEDEFYIGDPDKVDVEEMELMHASEPVAFWQFTVGERKAEVVWSPEKDTFAIRFEDGQGEVSLGQPLIYPPLASPDGRYFAYAIQSMVRLHSSDLAHSWSYAIGRLNGFDESVALAFSEGSKRFYLSGTQRSNEQGCNLDFGEALVLPLEKGELIPMKDRRTGKYVDGLPSRFPAGRDFSEVTFRYKWGSPSDGKSELPRKRRARP
jgi:hypothetical protein